MESKDYRPMDSFTLDGREINPIDPFHEHYFRLNRSKRNWQITCICFFILCLILLVSYVNLSNRVYIEPYIVFINEKEGIIRNIGELSHIKYVPNDKVIFSTILTHITDTRSIPLDYVMYGKNIEKQYLFLNNISLQKLLSYIEADNIKEMFKKKESRDIAITTILKMNNTSYQARWEETTYSENGTIKKKEKFQGIFTIEIKESKDEKAIRINPLGIIIKDFSYQKEL
ncbi:MAG: type IV secretion system protein [Fusobacteriaceae bacterium]|jgi:type IV secretion system protein VirB5|nr:type IV secretion system protein [Fusobacteriaceae bacterium]